ncbi:restriction endonuclease subunit S [Methylobacterium sp. sgz302541]|uniref:restriction endonuclease subunit S n=1 Tax=unclassified Methylobacterium TaxID=2615210 RepID=UPI003D352435
MLKPKAELAERIDLGFFAPVLTKVLREAATGRRKESGESDYVKIASKNASVVLVPVPVDEDGLPSLAFQEAVAARYASLQALKIRLAGLLADLSKKRIAFAAHQGATEEFKITDLFDVGKGNGGLTRSYVLAHAGEYPVYTGSSFRNETAGHIDSYAYEGDYLTWAADGYAGPVFARTGRFSANSHAGILKAKEEFAPYLHLPYLEYALTPIFESMAVGRYRQDGSPDYTRVTVGMVRGAAVILPVDVEGLPDAAVQAAISERIAPLERDKRAVEDELRRLVQADTLVDWANGLDPWREDEIEAA